MLAPDLAAVESAVDVMFVLRLDVSETSPLEAVMELVSDSWLFASAKTCEAVTDESEALASFQCELSVSGVSVSVGSSLVAT